MNARALSQLFESLRRSQLVYVCDTFGVDHGPDDTKRVLIGRLEAAADPVMRPSIVAEATELRAANYQTRKRKERGEQTRGRRSDATKARAARSLLAAFDAVAGCSGWASAMEWAPTGNVVPDAGDAAEDVLVHVPDHLRPIPAFSCELLL